LGYRGKFSRSPSVILDVVGVRAGVRECVESTSSMVERTGARKSFAARGGRVVMVRPGWLTSSFADMIVLEKAVDEESVDMVGVGEWLLMLARHTFVTDQK